MGAHFAPNFRKIYPTKTRKYRPTSSGNGVIVAILVFSTAEFRVIHLFEQTILHQYARREMIFSNLKTLPAFELITLKAVQSVANSPTGVTSWFDALDWMKSQINQTEFDIALIGCGAYGMPLAAHVKMLGKKAIHFGGSLQLLFGIKGKRRDEWKHITDLYNDYWIRPLPTDHPSGFQKVEEGCYW